MDATGQIFQISKFPDTVSFVIIPKGFWWNLTKIGQIHIPYKFARSGCIPPKIKCELIKVRKQPRATSGDYLASWNRKPIGQRNLLASMTMDQDLPRKVTHCRQVYLLSRSLKERWGGQHNNEQSCQKQRKTRGKNGKCAEEHDNESTYSFENYDSRWLLMLLYHSWYLHKEKEPRF